MSAFAKVVDPIKAVQFFLVVGKLKRLKRTGWVNHGIDDFMIYNFNTLIIYP